MGSATAFAQNIDTENLEKSAEIINRSSKKEKVGYLVSFLDKVKHYPSKFAAASTADRAAASNKIQLEHNLMLWTVFKNYKEKEIVKIQKATSKAYDDCLTLLNGDEWSKERQNGLDKKVASAKDLIKTYNLSE